MPRGRQNRTRRLLENLAVLADSIRSQDMKMLTELEKCPECPKTTALLADALAQCDHPSEGRDSLVPDASWVHPLV